MFRRWYIVYQTLNILNGKIYVGVHVSLVNPEKKFDGYLGTGRDLRRDIKKYGKEYFRRSTLCICNSKEEAIEKEREIVDKDFIKSKNTYNVHRGGSGCVEHSEVSKRNMSDSRKGENNNMYGKTHSEEAKKKMSLVHKGKSLSEDTKRKMGISRTGSKNGMYGVAREKFQCPECGAFTDAANMARWHGANCRVNHN